MAQYCYRISNFIHLPKTPDFKRRMKLSNKEYLVDITLKSLEVKKFKQSAKVTCELHYGDNYLRIKFQPSVKNGCANFQEERIRVPYAPQIALVFKMLKADKKQEFLGHYALDLEKLLKTKTFFVEINSENLEETVACVSFQCKIIDKALFMSESDNDPLESQDPASPEIEGKNYRGRSIQGHKLLKRSIPGKSLSQLDRPFRVIKKIRDLNVLLPQEYETELQIVEEILSKKEMYSRRNQLKGKYSRDSEGYLRSQKIIEIENRLIRVREEERIGTVVLCAIFASASFFIGFIL